MEEKSVLPDKPDGSMKVDGLLSPAQKQALINLQPKGVLRIDLRPQDPNVANETWLDYWFDGSEISENELRIHIQQIIEEAVE